MTVGVSVERPATRAHLGLALVVVSTAQLMVVLDTSIVNVAIPTIHRDLGFSEANLEWLVTAYALTFGGLLLFGGRTGDLYGKRRMFIVGIAVFASASLLAGLAQDQAWLIVARGLQGVGGAIASPTGLSLLATTFPEGRERNRAIGVYSAMSSAGGAIGLLLGGVLTSYVSWRGIFFINVPIAILALVLAPRVLTESTSTAAGRLDLPGALTVTAGMISLVYGVTNATTHGWGSLGTLVPLIAAGVLFGAFLVIERATAGPLMPLAIFADRNRSGAYAIMLTIGISVFSMFFYVTQYLQAIQGYSAIETGLAFLPIAIGIMVAAIGTAKLMDRTGIRLPLLTGPALALVGLAWMTRITTSSSYLDLLGPMLLLAIGFGQSSVPLTTTAVAGVDPQETGLASALLNTSQQLGGAIGLAVLGTVVAAASHVGSSDGHHLTTAAATLHGYADAFSLATVLMLAGLIVSAAVIRVRRTTDPGPSDPEGAPLLPESGARSR